MIPKLVETPRVRPKTYKELEQEENVRDKDAIFKTKGDVKIKTPKLQPNRRVLRIDHANIEPGVAIKLAISDLEQKDIDLGKECGIVLEELIRAAEKGQENYIVMDKYEPLPVENRLTRMQEEQAKAAVEAERQRNEKLFKHNEALKKHILEKRGDLDWQGRYRKKIATIEKEIRRKRNPNELGKRRDPVYLEELEKYYKSQKDKIKSYKDRMKNMEKELERSEKSRRSQRVLQRKNEFREFNQKEVRKQQTEFRKIEKYYRQKSAASLRASNYTLQKAELEPIKTKMVQEFAELRKKLESKKEEREKNIDEILKHPLYKKFLERHKKQLKCVYQTYLRQENYGLKNEEDPDLLLHKGMQNFCNDFKIVPFVISATEEIKLFKRFAMQRHLATEKGQPGLNYKQWERLLVEYACRKPKLFALVFDQRSATLTDWRMREDQRDAYEKKMADIKAKTEEQEKRKLAKLSGKVATAVTDKPLKDQKKVGEEEAKKRLEEKEKRKTEEEEYIRQVSQTPVRFMEGLVAYLEVPDTKAGIRQVINRNQSAITLPPRAVLKGSLK